MYHDTVTIFTRNRSRLGDMWYPTILHDVNVNTDRANIVSRYGEQAADSAVLNVMYEEFDGQKRIEGKRFLKPKEWDAQVNDDIADSITFHTGEDFDIFYLGIFSSEPIADDDYDEGFYDFMQANFDDVYAITGYSEFSVIPHFEIIGR